MKKGVKIGLIVLGSLVALIILALVVIPIVFKPQLLKMAQNELNKQLNAEVQFADLDISLIRHFPQASISLESLSVVNKAPFEGDTLASLANFTVRVNLLSLFDLSNLEVHEILLDRPRIYGHRDSLGRANWDIALKDSTATTKEKTSDESGETNLRLKLRKFEIRDAIVTYLDDSTLLDARLKHLNFTLGGDLGLKQTQLALALDIDSVHFASGGLTYVPNLRFGFKASIDADLENKIFKLADNEIALNDFILSLAGQVGMRGEAIDTDLTLVTNKAEIAGLLSLVPALYTQDLKGLKTSGTLQLSGFVKGTMYEKQLPNAEVKLTINNGTFQYAALPKAVTGLELDFLAKVNGTAQDSSILQLNNLALKLGGNPVCLQARVTTPLSDPNLWAKAEGHVELGTLGEFFPLGDRKLTGSVDLDLKAAALLSAVKKQKFEECTIDGFLDMKNVKLTQAMAEQDALLNDLAFRFSQKALTLEKFDANIGSSDVRIVGGISNFLPYYFGKEIIEGNLEVASKKLDLRELLPNSTEEKQEAVKDSTASVKLTPEQLDLFRRISFALRVNIENLFFQEYEMTKAGGRIDIKDGEVRIGNLGCVLFGGDARISGLLDLKTESYSSALDVNVKDFDVAACAQGTKMVRDLVPGIEYCTGHVGVKFTSNCSLDENFAPQLETVNATGRLDVGELAIKNAPLFLKFGEVLGNNDLANPTFKGGSANFEIEKGTLTIEPYNLKIKEVEGNIGGQVKLDQTMDMRLNATLPSSMLGKLGTSLSSLVSGYVKDFAMPAKLPVWIRATGNVASPKIDFGLDKVGTDNAKELVKEKVAEVIDKAKDRAKEEADKLIAEAQKKADQLVAEAKKLADKTREEAKKRAQQVREEGEKNGMIAALAAKKAAEKLEQEGEKAAQKIESEAQAKADDLIAKAKEQAEKIK
ncbi:MAG: AsmA-like C-terminal region-containing protein [Bacteroides sp.]